MASPSIFGDVPVSETEFEKKPVRNSLAPIPSTDISRGEKQRLQMARELGDFFSFCAPMNFLGSVELRKQEPDSGRASFV